MGYGFNSDIHLFNSCKKKLRENEIELSIEFLRILKKNCVTLYNFETIFYEKMENQYFFPSATMMFGFTSSYSMDEAKNVMREAGKELKLISDHIQGGGFK